MKYKCLWFTSCLLCLWYTVTAQDIPMLHFTTRDGLPSNTVYDIYKDSKGLLWFGTDKGIAVYNGIYFKYFTTYNGLPDNDVFYFKEDYQNRLWISTYSGTLCYYKDGVFHTGENTPFLKIPFRAVQSAISIEKDSSVTIFFNEIERFINVKKNDKIDIFNLPDFLGHEYFQVKVKKKAVDRYRLFFNDKTIDINPYSGSCLDYKNTARIPLYSNVNYDQYFLTDSGIYTENGTLIYPLKRLPIALKKKEINAYFDKYNTFIATYDGLFINNNIHLFPQKRITNVCADVNGNYWVASINNEGVYWLNKDYLQPVKYNQAYKGRVRQVGGNDSLLLFTTEKGDIYQFQKKSGSALLYKAMPGTEYVQSFIDDSLRAFVFSEKGDTVYHTLWDGQYLKKQSINGIPGINSFTNTIWVSQGKIYLHLWNTVQAVNYNALNKEHWKKGEEIQIRAGMNKRIFSPTRDNDGNLWFSTVANIWKIADTQGVIQKQFKNTGFRRFLFFGNYLIGYTVRNELLIVRNYTTKPIIDTVKGQHCLWDKLFPIDSRHLIITTNNFNTLLTIDSLPSFRYTVKVIETPFLPDQAEYVIGLGDECCFFKNGTITCVPFKTLLHENYVPRIFFTTVTSSGKIHIAQSTIRVSNAASKNISLQFLPLSFMCKDVICQYSISSNTVDHWETISSNEITFAALASGTYHIKVRARTPGSQFSKPAILTLIIAKPFWEEWWFRGLVAIVIGGFSFLIVKLIIRFSVKKKRKEFETVLKLQQSEYKALNSMMNPHFIFNSLNNIQSLIKKDDKATANKYLVIFANMVRQNMHNINKEKVTIRKELELVALYLKLEKLRFKERFEYKLNISEIEELDDIYIPALLIQPLVENSIKHGLLPRQGTDNVVDIDVHKSENSLYIIIGDNGVGLAEVRIHKDHESFALSNIHERIRHFNALYKQDISFTLKNRIVAGNVAGSIATIKIALLNHS